jgi:hypothetical protein
MPLDNAAPAAAACPACAMAQQEADSGMYRAGCQECAARMLAHGPEHFDAMSVAHSRRPMPRPEAGVRRAAMSVRDWAKRIEALRQARGMKGAPMLRR